MGGDILHVAHIFVTPFNLEGAYASINQRAEVGSLIVIFHRQQMFFIGNHPPLIVFQCVWQTARLRAIATVGATPCLRMRNVALTRIGHAQCAMNKEFNGRVRGLVNRADLLKIQFASTICVKPTSERNFAFSTVRISHCVLACSSIGGISSSRIPIS